MKARVEVRRDTYWLCMYTVHRAVINRSKIHSYVRLDYLTKHVHIIFVTVHRRYVEARYYLYSNNYFN